MAAATKHCVAAAFVAFLALSNPANASPAPVAALPKPAPQKPKTPINNPALFADFVKYPGYAASAIELPCEAPAPFGAVVQNYVNIKYTNTEATIYRNDADREIILAFPGTRPGRDYITNDALVPIPSTILEDGRCLGCLVHAGFSLAWASAEADTKKQLRAAQAKYPDYSLIVAGYSLGAALASIAFVSLTSAGFDVQRCYTIGEPRIGNHAWADFVDSLSGDTDENMGKYFRITHTNDGVPQIPPQSLGFRHPRSEYWELNGPDGVPTESTTYRCYGQEPTDCNNSERGHKVNQAHLGYAGVDTRCGV